MSTLFSSDWQTQLSNLSQCEEAGKRLLRIAIDRKVEAVVFAGDLKQNYNPCDFRVLEWWRTFLQDICKQGISPIVILGNHDRIGLYDDMRNWLPILRDAGATVLYDIGVVELSTTSLYVLPFIHDADRLKKASVWLAQEKTDPKRDLLTFHLTLKDSKFNHFGTRAEDGVPISVLHPEKFRFCIGGDIHLSQRVIDNVYYVGSPFPMDWGECNQTKYFALVSEKGLEWIPTGMPGWYDPSVKGFKPPKSWEGTRVRLHPVLNRSASIEQACAKAELDYPGALITLIPEIKDSIEDPKRRALETLSQQDQIRSYIQEVIPERQEEMIGLIEHTLRETGLGLREDTGIRFSSAWAKDFLSFKDLMLSFKDSGITLVTGENRDWPGRSNGGGKSNLVSVLPVALFGRTIKGQAHDDWRRWGSEGQASAGAEWFVPSGDKIRVERTRNPGTIRLWVNDREISSGNKVTDITKDIETLCGFSWDTFVSLVYISRDEINFLWGTPKQKQETLSRLLNLERFGVAQKKIRKEIQEIEDLKRERQSELQSLEAILESKQSDKTASEEIRKIETQIEEIGSKLKGIQIPETENLGVRLGEKDKELQAIRNKISRSQGEAQVLRNQIRDLSSLPDQCPTCGQRIPRDKKALEKQIVQLKKQLEVKNKNQVNIELEAQSISEAYNKIYEEYERKRTEAIRVKEVHKQLRIQSERLRQDLKKWEERECEYKAEMERLYTSMDLIKKGIETNFDQIEFLGLADKILQRGGLPAYLSEMLIPKLNQAAKKYSEIFTDAEIQIRFFMKDGETDVEIVNAHGGPNLKDQSSGEGSLAGMITSFSLRDVAPRSNILILDEPGENLDAENARAFAAGIRQLVSKHSTIFLITHNQNIISELSDIREIRVIKQNGLSFVVA